MLQQCLVAQAVSKMAEGSQVHPSRKTYQGSHENIFDILSPLATKADFIDFPEEKTKLDVKQLRTPCL